MDSIYIILFDRIYRILQDFFFILTFQMKVRKYNPLRGKHIMNRDNLPNALSITYEFIK